MKKEKKKFAIDSDILRIILIVLGSVFSTLVLTFAVLAVMEIQRSNLQTSSYYLLGIFVVLGLYRTQTARHRWSGGILYLPINKFCTSLS